MSMQTADDSDHVITANGPVSVEVVYALPGSVWQRKLQVQARSTVRQALEASGFFCEFPDKLITALKVGIYGQQCALDRILNDEDRIEIYRPLVFDPMESRRRRARHRQRTRKQG